MKAMSQYSSSSSSWDPRPAVFSGVKSQKCILRDLQLLSRRRKKKEVETWEDIQEIVELKAQSIKQDTKESASSVTKYGP